MCRNSIHRSCPGVNLEDVFLWNFCFSKCDSLSVRITIFFLVAFSSAGCDLKDQLLLRSKSRVQANGTRLSTHSISHKHFVVLLSYVRAMAHTEFVLNASASTSSLGLNNYIARELSPSNSNEAVRIPPAEVFWTLTCLDKTKQ